MIKNKRQSILTEFAISKEAYSNPKIARNCTIAICTAKLDCTKAEVEVVINEAE